MNCATTNSLENFGFVQILKVSTQSDIFVHLERVLDDADILPFANSGILSAPFAHRQERPLKLVGAVEGGRRGGEVVAMFAVVTET